MRKPKLRLMSVVCKPLCWLFLSLSVRTALRGNVLLFLLASSQFLGAGRARPYGMLGHSLSLQIKELEITSWSGFPSVIRMTDIAGGEQGL